MSKLLYAKLAASNLKKNRQNILPYLLSSIGTVMMFFIMASISANEGLNQMYGAQYITMVTEFGVGIIGLFSVVFLIYSNSFLMKRRKKEFGLFHILGMEKKHIALVLFFENLYLLVIALAAGIGLGVLLYRLMFLILVKLTGIEGTFGFQFYGSALGNTVILLAAIYLINFLLGLRQIQKSEPIELLKGSQVGEKEPKAKILSILTGVVTLGAGYYLAITCESSLEAFTTFFLAIVLVGVGTQCLFSSGSIALLKAMKRNKWYYYKLNHFTGVSGMLYRMKQNAAGLANICILSTGVLLVIALAASQADSAGVWVEIREEQRPGMEALYGAVLFFGIFVGILFLMGTVMIIYYKQVSEGYDDRERFQIMQKVGMSRREVKKCIHSQVLTVFFLPLVTAMIHTVVAFPFMTKIMRLLNFSNVHAFMIATGITIAVFAVVYVIVYAVTARTYYNIVEE